MTYLFNTTATMKAYNRDRWYINDDVIPVMYINADSITEALNIYAERVQNEHYIDISTSALRRKYAMYTDTPSGDPVQTGYVITASMDFSTDDYREPWVKQYIDLWVSIQIVSYPDFKKKIRKDPQEV